MRLLLFLTALLLITSTGMSTRRADAAPGAFEQKVLPLLRKRCYACHSHEGKLQGGLALDSRSGWQRGGDHGPAVKPGDVDGSLLIQAVRFRHAELRMPPSGRLPAAEIAVLEDWVRQGAADPRVASAPAAAGGVDLKRGKQFWAYRPVTQPAVPPVKNTTWPRDPTDRFILSKLENRGIPPAPDADRFTWLRRVSLDLTGLPPTPDAIQRYVSDQSPLADARVVDGLLNSTGFGERWARHWLDLTGYADQVGTSNDVFAEHAWRYRDYLIRAFNQDKPYDRLIREQVAGDLLPHKSAEERADNLVATGFLVLGDVEIVNPDKLKLETDHADQQVSKVSQAFLGQTVGCARCHDHKFDPIPQSDYYALAGIFKSTHSTHKIPYGIWSGINTVELPETSAQVTLRKEREAEHQRKLERLRQEHRETLSRQQTLTAQMSKASPGSADLKPQIDELAAKSRRLASELEHAEFFQPDPPRAFGVRDGEQTGDMRICIRGNPYALGPSVPRGFLRVASWSPPPAIPNGQSGRLQLADWLTDPRHPLTARVAVNRIWQKLFGEGLVRSVDYFGIRGEKPSHPELLDHLASRFMREGWSQKKLIRALVLSRTYRMSSKATAQAILKDPENRLLSRMNRQRLDAEAIRDGLLVVSGELKGCDGGPGLPLEYLENTGGLKQSGVNPPNFRLSRFRPEQEFQRSVYLPVIRSSQPAPTRLRDVFDFTQPAQMAGRRPQTVVPTQALFLLNNGMVRSRAEGLAKSILSSPGETHDRLEALWLRVFNRPILAPERDEAAAFLERTRGDGAGSAAIPKASWVELAHALIESNEFLFRL